MRRFRKVGVLVPVVGGLERNLLMNRRNGARIGRMAVVAVRGRGRGR